MTIAMYAGSFDPPTLGHQSVVASALKFCEKIIIVLAENVKKECRYSLQQRQAMLHALYADNAAVEVVAHSGLTVGLAEQMQADMLIRGVRQQADFADEYAMAMMNAAMQPQIQTVFIPASVSTSYIASSRVREILAYGGDVSDFVDPAIVEML